MILDKGKINIVLDGQFGSTGKGLLCSYVSSRNGIDVSVSNCSANAGHTFYYNGKKYIVSHIPVSSIINEGSLIYFSPAAVINVDKLLFEIEEYNINTAKIFIHPRASIISKEDIMYESNLDSSVSRIASTRSGVGEAQVRKIRRSSTLAAGESKLKHFIGEIDLQGKADFGNTVLVETSQGMDLSLNSGFAYPYCTSREITVSSTLSDVQVHPSYLGKVCVSIRTFPIRVGNIIDNGSIVGYSGPFYPDSIELSWEDIGVEPELTTITKRERRVATFSYEQYNKMMRLYKPDYVLLNFANYLSDTELNNLMEKIDITHISYGPMIEDVREAI